jgi:3-deoxy-D-manno-octulosonate 8-phosphate phosphatase (KDO 8-P phosphatase)
MNPYELAQRIKKIKYILMDVDGVLTDGAIYISDKGVESLRFDVKDGMGIVLLKNLAYGIGFISGRSSKAVELRAKSLGVSDVFQGVQDKLVIYEEIKEKYGLKDEEIAYIGDDLNDIQVMEKVGLAIAVADSAKEIRRFAHYVTRLPGGRGAIREVVDLFMTIIKKYPIPDIAFKQV